jgi:hypothetical protein
MHLSNWNILLAHRQQQNRPIPSSRAPAPSRSAIILYPTAYLDTCQKTVSTQPIDVLQEYVKIKIKKKIRFVVVVYGLL